MVTDKSVLYQAMEQGQLGVDQVFNMIDKCDRSAVAVEIAREHFLRAAILLGAWPDELASLAASKDAGNVLVLASDHTNMGIDQLMDMMESGTWDAADCEIAREHFLRAGLCLDATPNDLEYLMN